jgi:hypothetical protein
MASRSLFRLLHMQHVAPDVIFEIFRATYSCDFGSECAEMTVVELATDEVT